MGQARRVLDESEARRFLKAAARAGQSAGEWARAHGIDGRSLHAWLVNLEQRGAPAPQRRVRRTPVTHAVVEVVPEAQYVAPIARYVLSVADVRVEFGDDASTETLRRVLEAVRAC